MKILRWINFEVPVYWGKAWPRYVTKQCFRLPVWYIVVCVYAAIHIVTTDYSTISTNDHLHIGILLVVWVAYSTFLQIRGVWNLATIQYQAREYEYLACESCFRDMRDAEDGSECPECGAVWDRVGATARWTKYCDWAQRHNKRARPHKITEPEAAENANAQQETDAEESSKTQ